MRLRLPRSPGAAIASIAVAALAVTGVVVGSLEIGGSVPAANARPIPTPVIRIAHAKHGSIPWHGRLAVTVHRGTVQSVTVSSAGKHVSGAMHGTSAWRSAGPRLLPSTKYDATITVADEAGELTTVTRHLTTTKAKSYLTGLMSPNEETVGVGEPVSIHFESAVPQDKQAAVERHLIVTTTPRVKGAWHWFDDEDLHWRPASYWKPGTKVTTTMDTSKLYLGNGMWGQPGTHVTHFTVGDALISKVSVPHHVMRVYDNGRLVRTMPVSAGSPQYPTMGGTHVTLSKSPSVIMDSATVGIPKGSPGYYYETVYWDVRISDSGAYVHAAPWSVADQGNTNVSHGCINVSPANAVWFYHFSHDAGDIVTIDNPVRGPSPTDPGTEDWNMSWHQWLAGDALDHQQRKAEAKRVAAGH
jgi:lipoprotein-anchoring transpeptidase ErfK/SrfK